MAITDYSTLKAAVSTWLDRDDLSSEADTFIDLAEARIYRDLRIKAMETALSVAISGGVAAVPSDYLELEHAYLNTSPTTWLDVRNAQWIYQFYPTRSSTSKPLFIAREGDNFIFGPYPDSGYTVQGIYYAKLAALSDTNTTNWFTDNAPDLLLFGALVEATPFIGDVERAAVWEARFAQAMGTVQRQDKRERHPAGMSLRTRSA